MENNQTNWEDFFRTEHSNMIEDALPYLPMNLKKTAALYIKLQEIQNISKNFNQRDTLSACGFTGQDSASVEEILSALKLRAPTQTSKRIDEILQMLKIIKLMPLLTSQNISPGQNEFMDQLNQILKK
ncbi:MAG: hypothetical protein PHD70_06160 [Anaerostipes sp.]|jgi:hypothetical protein|nr:hypothetical protein [Anaerostipes sp.]MDD3746043.1 hypothetical protein [Anaerostipes sp.]